MLHSRAAETKDSTTLETKMAERTTGFFKQFHKLLCKDNKKLLKGKNILPTCGSLWLQDFRSGLFSYIHKSIPLRLYIPMVMHEKRAWIFVQCVCKSGECQYDELGAKV